jgi:GrpB-like predicted nucleotidyltransferase (UPF0157 family)
MRKVEVVPFNENWSVRFEEEARKIKNVFPTDMKSYIEGKDPFIKETEKKALSWYKHRNV